MGWKRVQAGDARLPRGRYRGRETFFAKCSPASSGHKKTRRSGGARRAEESEADLLLEVHRGAVDETVTTGTTKNDVVASRASKDDRGVE